MLAARARSCVGLFLVFVAASAFAGAACAAGMSYIWTDRRLCPAYARRLVFPEFENLTMASLDGVAVWLAGWLAGWLGTAVC